MMIGTCQILCLLLLLYSASASDEFSRKLTWELSPGCLDQLNATVCDAHRLLAVTATASDTLHVLVALWDAPAVLLLRAPLSASLNVNWTRLVSENPAGAVSVPHVISSYGVSLDQLVEFDDPSDNADLYSSPNVSFIPAQQLWLGNSEFSVVTNDSERLQVSLTSLPLNVTDLGTAGTVTFKIEVLNSERRSDELPHLQQTGNSAILGVVLDGLQTNANFSHARYGVALTAVGSPDQKLEQSKSLDDEYTPGVFKLVSLSGGDPAKTGFLQWRPVAYTDSDFTIDHSTTARYYNVSSEQGAPNADLLQAFFGSSGPLNSLKVTFGLAEDGWYKDTSYAAWSTTAGVGAPPADKLSLMVILLLSIGLGLPAVALVAGGVWLAVRRLRGGSDRSPLVVDED